MHGPRGGRGPRGGARALASGVLVFFFPRKKFALATPQGCRLLLPPLLRPWAHTSGCRLQSAFPCEKCKIFKSQRFFQLVQKERAPVSLGDSELQRESCLVPTRPDYRILPGHSGVAPFCRGDWLALGDLRICSDRILEACTRLAPDPGTHSPEPQECAGDWPIIVDSP